MARRGRATARVKARVTDRRELHQIRLVLVVSLTSRFELGKGARADPILWLEMTGLPSR
jgi:hypothetical protein